MTFELPELPFAIDALEPYISKKTIELHHEKHHKAYVSNLNKLLTGTKYINMDLETIIKVSDGPVFNNASQVWNHNFYFGGLNSGTNQAVKGSLLDCLKASFGSISFLKNSFIKTAGSLFGAGWVWLVLKKDGLLEVVPKSNAGNPMRTGEIPIMVCDMWEHAYYLDYPGDHAEYIEAFWKLINWEVIEERFKCALQ
jgi:Fe-Mn family superoxide dismutase